MLELKTWQSARLEATYSDLLGHPRYAAAARFFLEDLYGPKDMAQRDADTERILPKLTRVLPARALATIADAVELDALSETLDQHLALQPGFAGTVIDAAGYATAYRACSNQSERERQIALTRRIGDALDQLTRKPLLEGTLKLMRKPAQAAGLGALQNFLERGFVAFKAMHGAREFLDAVQERETLLMRRLFDAVEDPFTGLAGRPVV
ncbi:MAG: FFLEELY motif protein [Burkholderiales bacterium]